MGRPKGSTNKGTSEQKLLLAQQQQSNDIIKGKLLILFKFNNSEISSDFFLERQ